MKLRENLKNLTLVIAESIKALTNSKAESDLSNLSSTLSLVEQNTIKHKLNITNENTPKTPILREINDDINLKHSLELFDIMRATGGGDYVINFLFSDGNDIEISLALVAMEAGAKQRIVINHAQLHSDDPMIEFQLWIGDDDVDYRINGLKTSNGDVNYPIQIAQGNSLILDILYVKKEMVDGSLKCDIIMEVHTQYNGY